MRKYWVFFQAGFFKQFKQPMMMLSRMVFLTVVLLTMKQLWDAVGNPAFRTTDLLWYLAMNELIFFARPERTHKVIENDIRSGNIGYFLLRPFSYFGMHLSETFGGFLARLPIIFGMGCAACFVLAGGLPATFFSGAPVIFALMIPVGILSSVCHIFIGMLALYFQSVRPFYLIWQKLEFVLGGLFFPLSIYPDWLNKLAHMTPFPYMAYANSRLIYEFQWSIAMHTMLSLFFWIGAALLVALSFYNLLLRKVSVNGG